MDSKAEKYKSMRIISMYLIEYIKDSKGFNSEKAVLYLMKTDVFAVLMDDNTELYQESRECVLEMLKLELA